MAQPWFSQPAARLSALTALACFIVMALTVVVAGALTPGYSHVSQFISELGARGSPQEWGVRLAGFLPSGVLLLAFCWFAYAALPRSSGTTLGLVGLALYAAGYLVAAAYPCDLGCRPDKPSTSQLIHNAGGLLGYLLAPAFLLALARAAHAWPSAARLAVAGYAAAGLALVGLLTLSPTSSTAGLSQRLLEFAVLAWVVYCGRYLAKQGASVA
jgi:hypothetical membrane protein